MKNKTIRKPKHISKVSPLIGMKLRKLYLWFLSSYFPSRMAVYSKWFTEYCNKLNNLAECRGKREALAYNKLIRLSITRYLSGNPLPKNTPGIKLNDDGLPAFIYYLNPLIRGKDKDDLRIIFTMLSLTRGVVLEPLNDFSTIVDSWKGVNPVNWVTFQSAVKQLLGYKRIRYSFESLHTSTKSGPNGQAMSFAFQDFLTLDEKLKTSILTLGGPKMQKIMDGIIQTFNGIPVYQHWFNLLSIVPKKDLYIRRLSTFGDKEGKTRIIGILDYWSQAVLRPIHNGLMRILKKIPEDCTFDQNAWYNKLPRDCTYYSFDLSAATDRLPIKNQKLIMISIFGHKIANAWEDILVNYGFTHKQTNSVHMYGAGQPMGAYSSWPIMALQHHCIIWYAGLSVGVIPRGLYVVLGDDVVIANDQLAQSYTSVLKDLDVPISLMKTHKSKDICEFAKRWYYRGSEITAFPLHSLQNNLKRYYLLQNSIEDAQRKGYILSEESERTCLIELIKLTGKKEQAPRIYKLYKLFDSIVKAKSDDYSEEKIGDVLKSITANWDIPEANKAKVADVKSFTEHLDWCLEEYFLDMTSEGNNDMMEMMDFLKSWQKKAKAISEGLWEVLSSSTPIVISFQTCWKERSAILDRYYKEFANDKNKLRASLTLLGNLPSTSSRIVNTRSSHSILAAQSRLVKTLLDSLCKVPIPDDEMSDGDWMAQMKTIHSNDGD